MCVAAAAAFFLAPAHALYEEQIQLPTVVIVNTASFWNIYATGSVPSYGAVLDSYYYGSRYLDVNYYAEYLTFVADAKVNPWTNPDVRCNMGATAPTKATTSHHDTTDRYLAAAQLFAFIRGVDNAASLRALLRSNGTYFYNQARQFTFQITYADGGREAWIVASVLTGALVDAGNVPGSLVLGDGTIKSCTTTG